MICVTKRFSRSSPLFPVANAVVMRARSLCSSNVSLKEMFGRYSLAIMDCMSLWVSSRMRVAACFCVTPVFACVSISILRYSETRKELTGFPVFDAMFQGSFSPMS